MDPKIYPSNRAVSRTSSAKVGTNRRTSEESQICPIKYTEKRSRSLSRVVFFSIGR